MAELLVSTALETLRDATEAAPRNRFLTGSSRRKGEQYYADLKVVLGFLEFRGGFEEVKVEASELQRAITEFAYVSAKSRSRTPIASLFDVYPNKAKLAAVNRHISSLRKKVELVQTRDLSSSLNSVDPLDPSPAYHSDIVDDELLVGSGENIRELVTLLTGSGPGTVFLCGESGSGKTTVARKVFEHGMVRNHFESFAWVDGTSRNKRARSRDVWEGILEEIDERKDFKAMRDEEVVRAAFVAMKRRKCLVVIDGICDLDMWGLLRKFVLPEDHRSRILVTTTKEEPIIGSKNFVIFKLQLLNEHESWELFWKRVYDTNFEDDIKMKKLGEEMVRYCGGLPLAIVALSGLLLARKFKVNEWEKVRDDLKRHREKVPHESGLSSVLNLSYDEMPARLKKCFLYLSLFPEDYEIRAKELCQIWIAEKFVPLCVSAEREAYECLRELVRRCLVQVRKRGLRGRVKTCRIHDLVREFCSAKAQSNSFICVADFRSTPSPPPTPSTFPRLVVYCSNENVDAELLPLVQKKKDDSLRSFVCFHPAPDPHYERVLKTLFENFRNLGVLKFENLARGYVGKFPKEIKRLLLLRFLSLKNSHVSHLPSSIGRLGSLQTLDLRTNWRLELPVSVSKLTNLRHLYLPNRSILKGSAKLINLENLSNLKTLVSVSTKYCDVKDLAKLKNLEKLKLHIHDFIDFKKIFEDRSTDFGNLESLSVEICAETSMDVEPFIRICPLLYKLRIEGNITRLPEDRILSNLMKLQLKLTHLGNDPMEILGRSEKLAILVLDYNAFDGAKMVCSSGGFPRLESLSLVGLDGLEEWIVEEEALKNLTYLRINYCYNLKKIPEGLRNAVNLKEVVIQRMPRRFKKMMFDEQGKEPYVRRHVTYIQLLD